MEKPRLWFGTEFDLVNTKRCINHGLETQALNTQHRPTQKQAALSATSFQSSPLPIIFMLSVLDVLDRVVMPDVNGNLCLVSEADMGKTGRTSPAQYRSSNNSATC